MHTNHHPEHLTYPATKSMPVETIREYRSGRTKKDVIKFIKKDHIRRSRRYLKKEIRDVRDTL